jgi:hypothetical protein
LYNIAFGKLWAVGEAALVSFAAQLFSLSVFSYTRRSKMAISTVAVSPGSDVMEQAQERLRAALYITCRDIQCEYRHGLLILRGQVKSYYEKQLAQEAVVRLEGVAQVVNEIEVDWGEPELAGEKSAMILQNSTKRPDLAGRFPIAGNVPAKYQQALQCEDAEERCRCLKEAAEAGYIPAMCDYGLMCQYASERKRWLLEAACEGYVPAMHHYALECEDKERRNRWLREASCYTPRSASGEWGFFMPSGVVVNCCCCHFAIRRIIGIDRQSSVCLLCLLDGMTSNPAAPRAPAESVAPADCRTANAILAPILREPALQTANFPVGSTSLWVHHHASSSVEQRSHSLDVRMDEELALLLADRMSTAAMYCLDLLNRQNIRFQSLEFFVRQIGERLKSGRSVNGFFLGHFSPGARFRSI